MKKVTLLGAILISCASYAQEIFTSFEEPEVFPGNYTDTGDPNVAHDLVNNTSEPLVDFTATGGELGFNARYVPYDTPGVGLTDGDAVGVTDDPPTGTDPYTNGVQGYQISDVDGNFILEFDPILSSKIVFFYIDLFVSETGYEGDGTVNESGSDRLHIYVREITGNGIFDIVNTTGTNINDVLIAGVPIEGRWFNVGIGLDDFDPGTLFQLVIEVRCNSSAEAFFFDNFTFGGVFGIEDNNKSFFSLFPNPATKDFVIIKSKIEGDKNITVFDALGRQVANTTITNDRLDVSTLTTGVYFIKISQGVTSTIKKLVKL